MAFSFLYLFKTGLLCASYSVLCLEFRDDEVIATITVKLNLCITGKIQLLIIWLQCNKYLN